MLSIQQALNSGFEQLKLAVESPQREAELLLAHVMNSNRTQFRTWPERILTEQQLNQYTAMVDARLQGQPIAYLLGKQGFWSLDLFVNSETLIPRPETERLVELALDKIPADCRWRIADLGTGTGAIALALARERPMCQLLATDKFACALDVARNNARENNIDNIQFKQSNWFEKLKAQPPFEMIVSNPPYIPQADPHLQQGDVRFEPNSALVSGVSGLDDIGIIIEQSAAYLKQDAWLLLEHGYDQKEAVIQLMEASNFRSINDFHDLNQQPRVIIGQK
jgi:release factor glutamine methyltransferase